MIVDIITLDYNKPLFYQTKILVPSFRPTKESPYISFAWNKPNFSNQFAITKCDLLLVNFVRFKLLYHMPSSRF